MIRGLGVLRFVYLRCSIPEHGAVASASILGIGSPSGVLSRLGVVSLLSHADEGGSPIGGNVQAKVLKSLSSMISANFL